MIRINPDSRANLLTLLNASKIREETALKQLSTGRRVNVPSDDPSAAAAMIDDSARNMADDQFVQNIETVREWLTTADSSLSSVVSSLQRAMTLAVEGATGTQSDANRQAIANDIRGIKEQVLSLANLSFRGRYVFAGSATDKPPYIKDATVPSGVTYQGNVVVNQIPIGERRTVAMNMPGTSIFGAAGSDVFSTLESLAAALESGNVTSIQAAASTVRGVFDQVVASRVFYGNACNQLDADESFLSNEKVQLQTHENRIVGADPAKATSDLTQAQWARQATLTAAARTSQMSLLDYLK